MGIRHAGEETAIALANHFLSLDKVRNASKVELERIPDIGSVVAQSIAEWFKSKTNQRILEKLFKVGVKIQNPKPSSGSKSLDSKSSLISGKTFVLTGTLSNLTRDEAKQRIRHLGGSISESVSKNTNYVVAGANPGSKLQQAQKMGIHILTEKQFLNLLKT